MACDWRFNARGLLLNRCPQVVKSFMTTWRRDLEAATGKAVNQYIFNNIFNKKG